MYLWHKYSDLYDIKSNVTANLAGRSAAVLGDKSLYFSLRRFCSTCYSELFLFSGENIISSSSQHSQFHTDVYNTLVFPQSFDSKYNGKCMERAFSNTVKGRDAKAEKKTVFVKVQMKKWRIGRNKTLTPTLGLSMLICTAFLSIGNFDSKYFQCKLNLGFLMQNKGTILIQID